MRLGSTSVKVNNLRNKKFGISVEVSAIQNVEIFIYPGKIVTDVLYQKKEIYVQIRISMKFRSNDTGELWKTRPKSIGLQAKTISVKDSICRSTCMLYGRQKHGYTNNSFRRKDTNVTEK